MKQRLCILLLTLVLPLLAVGADKLTFVPVWTPQTQFAGYYVAQEKGFYAEEGLDVTISHVGVNSNLVSTDMLQDGSAQIVGMQLLSAMKERSLGVPLVNVLQTSQNSALYCVSHTPVTRPEDLNGLKVASWQSGFSEGFEMMVKDYNLSCERVRFIQGVNLYVFGAVDAILCYSFNEYIQLLLALGSIPDEQVMKFSEWGYNFPEDGLYVNEKWLEGHADEAARFVRASCKGWQYCHQHPEEAMNITMEYVERYHIATSRVHQKLMLEQVLKTQLNPETGKADFAPISRERYDQATEKMIGIGLVDKAIPYDELIHPVSLDKP